MSLDKEITSIKDHVDADEVEWVTSQSFWQVGDQLDFVTNYYSYTGDYQDYYSLGDPMTVDENMVVSYVDLGPDNLVKMYRFTDLDQNYYWTDPLMD